MLYLIIALNITALLAFVAYKEAAKFEEQYGTGPWRTPPLVWAIACLLFGFIGAMVLLVAETNNKSRLSDSWPVHDGAQPPAYPSMLHGSASAQPAPLLEPIPGSVAPPPLDRRLDHAPTSPRRSNASIASPTPQSGSPGPASGGHADPQSRRYLFGAPAGVAASLPDHGGKGGEESSAEPVQDSDLVLVTAEGGGTDLLPGR